MVVAFAMLVNNATAQLGNKELMDYLRKYAVVEQEVVNDTLTYTVIQNQLACIIYDGKNHLFGLTNEELNGNSVDDSKSYDYGAITLEGLELAIEETFSEKERYELG